MSFNNSNMKAIFNVFLLNPIQLDILFFYNADVPYHDYFE